MLAAAGRAERGNDEISRHIHDVFDKGLSRLPEGVDFLTRPSGPVTLVDSAAGTRLQLQHHEPMDLTVVWTEPPRPMVCLEPWTGPRQSLISGDRKLELAAGQSSTLTCRYALS